MLHLHLSGTETQMVMDTGYRLAFNGWHLHENCVWRGHGAVGRCALEQSPNWGFLFAGAARLCKDTGAFTAQVHLRRLLLGLECQRLAGNGIRHQPVLWREGLYLGA